MIIEEEGDKQPTTTASEILRYQHQWGQLSFRKIQRISLMDIIPNLLVNLPVPDCSTCLYAKSTRKNFINNNKKNYEEPESPTRPDKLISVDQLISPTTGYLSQINGILTINQYRYATLFVDHCSSFIYTHFYNTPASDETI